jgi:beta-glucosidase
VALAPGESARVEVTLAEHAFDAYDVAAHAWRTVPGAYTVLAGASSRDIRLSANVKVAGKAWKLGDAKTLPHYVSGHVERADAAEFELLQGSPLPSPAWTKNRPLTRDDIVAQTKGRGGFASVLYTLIDKSSDVLLFLGRPLAANNTRFALDLPFRSIPRLSGGAFNDEMLDGLLLMVNRRFFRGTRQLISAALRLRAEKTPRK